MAYSTTNAVLLTGVVVTAGQWSENKPLTPRVVIGCGVLALMLAAIGEANPNLGARFALLILVGAFLRYGVSIFSKILPKEETSTARRNTGQGGPGR